MVPIERRRRLLVDRLGLRRRRYTTPREGRHLLRHLLGGSKSSARSLPDGRSQATAKTALTDRFLATPGIASLYYTVQGHIVLAICLFLAWLPLVPLAVASDADVHRRTERCTNEPVDRWGYALVDPDRADLDSGGKTPRGAAIFSA